MVENANAPLETVTTPVSWNLYADGSSTKDGSRADLIIETSRGERHEHGLKFIFKASNNEVEYKTLIAGIQLCYTVEEDSIKAYSESQLVNSQPNGDYEVKTIPWLHMSVECVTLQL